MKLSLTLKVNLFFLAGLILLLAVAVASLHSTLTLVEASEQVGKTHAILAKLENLLSLAVDAETGASGYLVTGDDRYLDPYREAGSLLDQRIGNLRALLAEKPEQQKRLSRIDLLLREKLAFIRKQIDLRETEGFEAARESVLTHRGKDLMDEIRVIVQGMEREENELLARREELTESDTVLALGIILVGSLLSLGIVGLALVMINRDIAIHTRDETEKTKLAARLQDALAHIKTLSGLLPVCGNCKQLRDDLEYRARLDTFLRSPSQARFPRETCPACREAEALKGAPTVAPSP